MVVKCRHIKIHVAVIVVNHSPLCGSGPDFGKSVLVVFSAISSAGNAVSPQSKILVSQNVFRMHTSIQSSDLFCWFQLSNPIVTQMIGVATRWISGSMDG
jgi:hypothetical protein